VAEEGDEAQAEDGEAEVITSWLILQLGFGSALPAEGPIAPYSECITKAASRAPDAQLREPDIGAKLDAECADIRKSVTEPAIDAAVERAKMEASPLSRNEIARFLPFGLLMGVLSVVDREREKRGMVPANETTEPKVEVPQRR
jgi:hypothetical protein